MAYIRVKTGPNKGKIFEIKDAVITIGRDESQTIQVLDQGVSRQHAEIFRIGEMCFLRDLNSTNGVYVNNLKVSEEALKANDELLIGTTILVFEERPSEGGEGEGKVQFEVEEEKIKTTTVELSVDPQQAKHEKILGQEVQSRNLTVTSEIGKIINSGKDFQSILTRVVEVIADAISANHGYIFLHDPVTAKLTPKVIIEREDSGGEKKVSRTIIKRVLSTGMPILTSDAALDERFALSESIVLKKIKSVVCAPIRVRDKMEGVLYFHSNRVNATFRVDDLELVTSAALHLTMAVGSLAVSEKIRKGMLSTIKALVTAMEIVDPKNQGHAERVSEYSAALGRQINLSVEEIHKVRLAAYLHDVGKLAVHHSAVGITKETIREQHVFAGERILQSVEGFEEVLPGLRYHHERADGSGFPYHVKNDQTPLMARIIIVTNAFDNACTWGGMGGQGIPAKDVLKDMAQRGGKEFDDAMIKALLICHRNGTLYSNVKGLES